MTRCAFASALIFLATCSSAGLAQDVIGKIKEIDAAKGTITLLAGPLKAPVESVYSLDRPDLPVKLPTGKPGKIADLKVGGKVAVQLLGADVTAIRVIPATLVASFSRRDEKAKTVAVRLAGSFTDSVYPCEDQVPLLINNKSAAWSELKAGKKIQLVFIGDKTHVFQAEAGPNIESAKETKANLTRLAGVLLEHDPVASKAGVLHIGVSLVEKKVFRVAGDAPVQLFHAKRVLRKLTYKDLAPYLKIHYFADVDTQTIVAIDAELPVMRRKLVALDTAKGKLTIEDGKRLRTFELAAKVPVYRNGKEASLAEVPLGLMTSIGLSFDRVRVDAIFLAK